MALEKVTLREPVGDPRAPPGRKPELSSLVASVVAPESLEPYQGTDNQYHLTYELQMLNASPGNATLTGLAILGPGQTPVHTYNVTQLVAEQALRLPTRAASNSTTIPSGESRVLLLDVAFPSRAQVPAVLDHRFNVQAIPPLGAGPSPTPQPMTFPGAAAVVSGGTPVILSPPLEGRGWMAFDGPPDADGHHRNTFVPYDARIVFLERYSIDWTQVSDDGRLYNGDGKANTDWFSYGKRILAAGAGVVVTARDGLPDQTPLSPPTLGPGEAEGNHVVIDMGGNRYAFYAHMQPGSLRVRVGDTVRAGDQLGLLGNSGATIAPHLHFQVNTGSDPLATDCVPYLINRFTFVGRATNEQVDAAIAGQGLLPVRSTLTPQPRTNQLPLSNTLVDF